MAEPATQTTATIEWFDRLDPAQVGQVLALAQAAAGTDGTDPLPEQVVIALRDASPARHLTLTGPAGELIGYAHLDPADPAGPVAELVVHPAHRRHRYGRRLLTELLGATDPTTPLRAWAHGDHPSAAALALDHGFVRDRVLLQLRRRLTDPLPEPALPSGVRVRAFEPGRDDAAWVALNVTAFADHPEQGRWGLPELHARMAQPWFDPAGFLLAEDQATGRLLGFHWTKVHTGPAVGEVYVLGVDPQAHGGGLGRALTLAGLRQLAAAGLRRAMLYVEESNAAAVHLYTRLGFLRWSADVNYRREPTGGGRP
ncbi:mycothiol synthase [Micromonospora sp. NBC_01813]|uniref:mycothiol synthase n=1 Tax=Micromonospora sp. NBC_01813 TaxID=2975988 RepID=UPI002DDBC920|nr:mycothiol synthase [Micromonospora sp. NBC_01813]WSA06534.1 mycothiol synthase [Micromonospora sp. NBC_01813]